jgi:hypothetical protein
MRKLTEVYTDEVFPLEVDIPFHESISGEHDIAFFEIDSMEQLIKINRLAAEFYSMNGRVFLPDDDFYLSTHPEEESCFYKACLAFYYMSTLKDSS